MKEKINRVSRGNAEAVGEVFGKYAKLKVEAQWSTILRDNKIRTRISFRYRADLWRPGCGDKYGIPGPRILLFICCSIYTCILSEIQLQVGTAQEVSTEGT